MEIQNKDVDSMMKPKEGTGGERTRRVGSVTLGLTLILFGILFLVHTMAPSFDYEVIFQFWPVIFILLGVETLVENHKSNSLNCRFIYDFPAIIMLILMLLFAMVMAAAEFSMRYYQDIWW